MKRLLYVFCLTLSACQTVEVDLGKAADSASQTRAQASLGLGIYELSPPMALDCPAGAGRVVIRRTPVDFLIHFFAGGIYTRYTAEGWCKGE